MNVTLDDLVAIIGQKEVTIHLLQKQLAEEQKQLAEAKAKLEAPERDKSAS